MRKQFRTDGTILRFLGAAAVAAVVSITLLVAMGWQRPGAASHGRIAAVNHSLPHWMMAVGLLGSPAIMPNTSMPPGNAYTGVADYLTPGSYPFTVPDGVTTVLVQLYGAGGGGGGQNTLTMAGGGGGGGAFVMSVVTVTPGETYVINAGAGGTGGGRSQSGMGGAATSFVDSTGTVLVAAGGGAGGDPAGHGGAGGLPVGSPQIGRAGFHGGGTQNGFSGVGASGYTLSTVASGSSSNSVGAGGDGGSSGTASSRGQNGYAFIAW